MSNFAKIHELYTTREAALDELMRRRTDAAWCKQVDTVFSSLPRPDALPDALCGLFSPTLATPNLEMLHFLKTCAMFPLPIVCLEYTQDKFVHLNAQKHYLGNLVFFHEGGHGERRITDTVRIVDFGKAQGHPMNEILTTAGENFVHFHHRLLRAHATNNLLHISDFSAWFRASKEFEPSLPYLRYLALAMKDGILFANFTTEKREAEFTDRIVLPAFRALRDRFGYPPLIVPVEPTDSDELSFWSYYPERVRGSVSVQ